MTEQVPPFRSDPTSHLFGRFALHLQRATHGAALRSLILALVIGGASGIGILLVLPILHLSGVIEQEASSGALYRLQQWLTERNVSFSLELSLVLFCLLIAAYSGLRRYQAVHNDGLRQRFIAGLSSELFGAISQASWNSLLRTRKSDLVQTLADDLKQLNLATVLSMQLVSSLTLLAFNGIVAALISPPLVIPALAALGLLWLLMRPLHRRSAQLGHSHRAAQQRFYELIGSHLDAIKFIRCNGFETRQAEDFGGIRDNIVYESMRFRQSHANAQWFYETGAAVALALFVYGAIEWAQLGAASIVLLVFIFARAMPHFSRAQQSWQALAHALPSYAAYSAMLEHLRDSANKEATQPTTSSSSTLPPVFDRIVFDHVSFAYPHHEKQPVFENLNIEIPAKSLVALVGPSGSGKSTIADLLVGIIVPQAGTIRIDGVALCPANVSAWRQRVAYVTQENFLLHDSVKANLLWAAPSASENDIWQALDAAKATEIVTRLPQGLDTPIGERGSLLSGGERQRIALARALLKKPLLLILDEATNALDLESEAAILDTLEQLSQDLTVMVITHRQEVAERCGRVIETTANGSFELPTP